MRGLLLVLVGLGFMAAAPSPDLASNESFDVVVIDPGHGGPDYGARGASGLLEKDVVLQVARRVGRSLEKLGLRVVFTRTKDEFVSLPERTDIANRARGDLYLSIHANSAPDREARGPETYFLSLDASDEDALRVAIIENEVFGHEGAVSDGEDIVGAILGDLIRTEHLRASSQVAAEIQRKLSHLPGPSRGVK